MLDERFEGSHGSPDNHNIDAEKADRTWGMICHLSSLAGFVVPFGNIIAPLVIWVMKKDESRFVDHHGKEAINFQISVTIYTFIAAISIIVLLGIVLLPAVLIFDLVLTIIAAIKANDGAYYRYPLTIRLV